MGYRPCLRCRPELAPGHASVDAGHRLARSAANLIADGAANGIGVGGVARSLGVTARHLRRVFQGEFGVSPIRFAQTQRLLLAKRLLTDTALPVTEVAFAAGFNSLRRFDGLFKERYRLNPQRIRKPPRGNAPPDALTFELSYRPPYDWHALLTFLAARSVSGVERVEGSRYRRIVSIVQSGRAHTGWIEIAPHPRRSVMRVMASASMGKVIPALLSRVTHLLDLSCNPTPIAEALGRLAAAKPGLRVPGAFDGFELAVRAVLGQQVSVAAARTLAGRVAAAYGSRAASPFETLSTAFPQAEQLASVRVAELVRLGILRSRARTVRELAKLVADGSIALTPETAVAETIEKLRAIAGIGGWTAQYIAMRALAWPDAFPHTDLGVMRALGERNPKRVLAAAEAWRPWRAYAVMHLWMAEGSGGTLR
ncbi:MAG TPA: DNA-3-methyladenine glycosylase 2 [bacterium]|nr:DNA-3-methyladenine glycosylase 2 [bacterium]